MKKSMFIGVLACLICSFQANSASQPQPVDSSHSSSFSSSSSASSSLASQVPSLLNQDQKEVVPPTFLGADFKGVSLSFFVTSLNSKAVEKICCDHGLLPVPHMKSYSASNAAHFLVVAPNETVNFQNCSFGLTRFIVSDDVSKISAFAKSANKALDENETKALTGLIPTKAHLDISFLNSHFSKSEFMSEILNASSVQYGFNDVNLCQILRKPLDNQVSTESLVKSGDLNLTVRESVVVQEIKKEVIVNSLTKMKLDDTGIIFDRCSFQSVFISPAFNRKPYVVLDTSPHHTARFIGTVIAYDQAQPLKAFGQQF